MSEAIRQQHPPEVEPTPLPLDAESEAAWAEAKRRFPTPDPFADQDADIGDMPEYGPPLPPGYTVPAPPKPAADASGEPAWAWPIYEWLDDTYVETTPDDTAPSRNAIMSPDEMIEMQRAAEKRRLQEAFQLPDMDAEHHKRPDEPALMVSPEERAQREADRLDTALAQAADPDLALEATEGDIARSFLLTRGIDVGTDDEMQRALTIVRNLDPDQEKTVQNIARAFGVSPDIVRRDLPGWKETQTAGEIWQIINERNEAGELMNPVTRKFLLDPGTLSLSKDDARVLRRIENATLDAFPSLLDESALSIRRAVLEEVPIAIANAAIGVYNALTYGPGEGDPEFSGDLVAPIKQYRDRPESAGFAYDFFDMVGQIAGAGGALLVTKNPIAPAMFMWSYIFGETYEENISKGLTHGEAFAPAVVNSSVQSAMEFVRFRWFAKLYSTVGKPTREMIKQGVITALESGGVELGQEIGPELLTRKWADSKLVGATPEEQRAWFWNEVTNWDNWKESFKQGTYEAKIATLWGVLLGMPAAFKSSAIEAETRRHLDARAAVYDTMAEAVKESKLRERDPAKFEEFARQVDANAGLPAIYVDYEAFGTWAQTNPKDAKNLAKKLDIQAQIDEAEQHGGGDLTIDLAKWKTHAIGTPAEQAMLPHIRWSPQDESEAEIQAQQKDFQTLLQAKAKEITETEAALQKEPEPDALKELRAALERVGFQKEAAAFGAQIARRVMRGFFKARGEEEAAGWARLGMEIKKFQTKDELDAYLAKIQAPKTPPILETQEALGSTTKHDKGYLVSILGKGNLSTMLHEFSHVFMMELNELVEAGKASERLKEAHAALMKEAGGKLDRAGMENIAGLFENYYEHGRAPSLELSRAFAYFSRALSRIYKKLGKKADLNEQVKRALDALHATEQEVADMLAADSLRGEWRDAVDISKASDEAKKRVRQKREDVEGAAIARRLARIIKALRKARGGVRGMREKIRAEVVNDPTYKAIAAISDKGGISLESFKAAAPGKSGDAILKKFPKIAKDKSTLAIEFALWDTGFNSPGELVTALTNALPIAEEVDRRLQQKFAEDEAAARDQLRSGPMQDDEDFLTDERLELAAAEHDVMTEDWRKEKAKRQRRMSVEAMKREAGAQIERTPLEDAIRTDRYLASARRYSRKALDLIKAGKVEESLAAKKLEVYHYALAQASMAARKWDASTRKYVSKAQTVKTVEFGWQEQIRALAQRMGFDGPGMLKPDEHIPLSEWLGTEGVDFLGTQMPIADWIVPEDKVVNYRTLPLKDAREIREAIQAMRVAGSTRARAIKEGQLRTYDAIATEGSKTMAALPSKSAPDQHKFGTKTRLMWRSMIAEITTPQLIFRAADGYPDLQQGLGFNERVLWGGLDRAHSRQSAMLHALWKERLEPISTKLRDFRNRIESRLGKYWEQTNGVPVYADEVVAARAKQLGIHTWDANKLISIILNLGNPGNETAIQYGLGYSTEQRDALRAMLTTDEYAMVQDIWDACESLYEPMDKVHRRLRGVPTKRVEAQGFYTNTADGKYIYVRGGYYPLVVDTRLSDKIAELAADDWLLEQKSYKDSITRYRGPRSPFAFQRKGMKIAPLLSLDVFYKHIFDVAHYIAQAEILYDIHKVTSNPAWKNAARTAFGDQMYDQIPKVLRDAARQDTRDELKWGNAFERQRQLAILNLLSLNMRTLLVQPSALLYPGPDVGLANMGQIAWESFRIDADAVRRLTLAAAAKLGLQVGNGDMGPIAFALENSQYLRDCLRTVDRDIADAMARQIDPMKREMRLYGVKISRRDVQEFFMQMIGAVDFMARGATWNAMYKYGTTKLHMDHDAAVTYANAIASATNPGPRPIDLSSVQRSKGLMRLLTMFMGPSIVYGSRTRYFWRAVRAGKPGAMKRFAAHIAWEQIAAPLLVTQVLHLATSGEPADLLESALGQFRWYFSFIPGIAMLFDRREPNTPVLVGLKRAQAVGRNIADLISDPGNAEEWATFLLSAGELADWQLGIPVTRASRTAYEGIRDLEAGETVNPLRLFIRKDKEHD